jgi:hypothetical protein
MIVQRGTVLEYFQIEALRAAYFAEWGEQVHRRPPGTVWWIARDGDRVLACTSYYDKPPEGRMMQDFYCVKGPLGIRALRRLRDELFAEADAEGLRLVVPCNPMNTAMLRAYGWELELKRTRHCRDLVPVAVIMIREPKET